MRPVIILFVYSRLEHTIRTVEALLTNLGVEKYDLIIYADAASSIHKKIYVEEVRDYIKTIRGFQSVDIRLRSYNFGLSKSIIEGVTEVLAEQERVIVLEDDMVTSPYFLTFMNEMLDRFAHDDRVISIHGYVYPVDPALSKAFFLRGADCWGWATWRRGWKLFNPDGQALLEELKRRNLIKEFNFNGAYSYSQMLESQIKGAIDSWAIRWYASAFLADKLTLYPAQSLLHNIGNDGSGTHCGTNSIHDVTFINSQINSIVAEVKHSQLGFSAFERFFRDSETTLLSKLTRRLKQALSKVFA